MILTTHVDCSANITFEPWHEISNNVVCATSKGSDQPAHTCRLIRAFASRLNILLTEYKFKRRLHRRIWVYTCQNASLMDITWCGSARLMVLSFNREPSISEGSVLFLDYFCPLLFSWHSKEVHVVWIPFLRPDQIVTISIHLSLLLVYPKWDLHKEFRSKITQFRAIHRIISWEICLWRSNQNAFYYTICFIYNKIYFIII